jgi:hypothetical protein
METMNRRAVKRKSGRVTTEGDDRIVRELANFESFDRRAEQSIRVSERTLNSVVRI